MNRASTIPSPSATTPSPTGGSEPETDAQLMARIQARDDTSLAALARRYHGLLRSIITRVLHSDADVDEVMQDVVLEVWNRAHTFREEKGKVHVWLGTLAHRRAIDRIRRRFSYLRATDRHRTFIESQAPAFESGADAAAHSNDLSAALRRILAALPLAQRQAVELNFYGGLSQREIARATGFPLGTVKTRIELGLRKAHTALSAMGGADVWFATSP